MEQDLRNEIQRLTKLSEDLKLTIKTGANMNARLTAQIQELSVKVKQLIPQSEVNMKVRAQVNHFFNSQDNKFLENLFRKYAEVFATYTAISEARLGEALAELGLRLSKQEIRLAMKGADLGARGYLNLEEFRQIPKFLMKTELEEWVSMLPLAALLRRCLSFKGGNDSLNEAANFTVEERGAVVHEFSWGLARLLEKAFDELKELSKIKDEAQEPGARYKWLQMSAGTIDTFHDGLGVRVGAPHTELDKGLRQEHCEKAGCDVVFETSNYGVSTTPRKEYEIIIEGKECPQQDRTDKRGKVVRVVRRIADLKKLKKVENAKLNDLEIAAVVMYTGPMLQIYNTVLRRYPQQEFQRFKDGANLFSTTIHVIVSAVMKLSRTQTLPSGLELYRGLGGLMDLPEVFFQADECGRRGCVEWGFFSTTSDKRIAIEYSGLKDGRPLPKLLRMITGSVDRPACIYDLSQYPGEREYLFLPCSFLEPLRVGRFQELVRGAHGAVIGALEVVEVRVNANLKGQTVEELEGRKKALHLDAFRYGIDDAARELEHIAAEDSLSARLSKDPFRVIEKKDYWVQTGGRLESLLPSMLNGETITFTGEGLHEYLVREALAVLTRHSALPNQTYASLGAYHRLAWESLCTLQACTAFLRCYIEDPNYDAERVMRTGLMDGLRTYRSLLWRRVLAAGEHTKERAFAAGLMCVSLRLMETSAEEEDAEGLTPLMRAAADGAGSRVLRCLVWAGAQINRQHAVDKRSALSMAAQFGHAHVVEELARLRADVNLTCGPALAKTPAWTAAQEGHVEVVQALGRLGADLNRCDRCARTPMFIAAQKGHLEVVRALFSLKADVDAPRHDGWTPLAVATQRGHVAVSVVLRSMGAH